MIIYVIEKTEGRYEDKLTSSLIAFSNKELAESELRNKEAHPEIDFDGDPSRYELVEIELIS